MSFKLPERFRVLRGEMATLPGNPAGLFLIRHKGSLVILRAIASAGDAHPGGPDNELWGWDHVSVSPANRERTPTWEEMCLVKDLFWDEEDTVMQLHPPRSRWISNHPHVLHLWRPTHKELPTPPDIMVGIKELGELPR